MKLSKIIAGSICVLSVVACSSYVIVKQVNKDTIAPVIEFQNDVIHASVNDEKAVLLGEASASDDKDGDVTNSLLTESVMKKPGTKNEFAAVYVAFDEAGNHGKAARTIVFDDYYSPRFTINQNLRFPKDSGISIKNLAQASDCFGNDLTPYIMVEGTDLFSGSSMEAGAYDCKLKVQNSVGDVAELPISIEIYEAGSDEEKLRPEVALSSYVVYIPQGTTFDYAAYIKYVEDSRTLYVDNAPMIEVPQETGETTLVTQAVVDGREGDWINISQIGFETDLDVNVAGTYTGTYSYTSERTGLQTSSKMYIVVE